MVDIKPENYTYEKFDSQTGSKYWDNYYKHDRKFYSAIKEHMKLAIAPEGTNGLDIGAGPGIGAKLLSELKFKTYLIGIEPSKTAHDGEVLSKQLEKEKSTVIYVPEMKNVTDLQTPPAHTYDYFLILRAAHEIGESLGSKSSFYHELARLLPGLKPEGFLIIADPQFSSEKFPKKLMEKMQAYQKKHIGHCHAPGTYIQAEEMKKNMATIGLKLVKETLVSDDIILNHLNSLGESLKISPINFYVHTYRLW